MRIGLIYYDEYPSGIKTYTLELGRALVSHGLHVRIFGQTATGDSPVAGADFSPIEVPESQEFLRHPIRRCREIGRKMESACRSLRIQSDVYHSVFPACAMSFRDQPLVVTARYYPSACISGAIKRWAISAPGNRWRSAYWQFLFNVADHLAYRRAARVLAITRLLGSELNRQYGDKVCYLPPGIATDNRSPAAAREPVTLLFAVVDLSLPKKNFRTFLKAITLLTKMTEVTKFRVVIVGRNCHLFQETISRIQERGVLVQCFGFLDEMEMNSAYRTADIFISTSQYEQFGYALLEALAHHLVLVASDIHAHRDMVQDTLNGFLFPANDFHRLAHLLGQLIERQETLLAMREANREAATRYSWDNLVPQYVQAYATALAGT